MKKMTLVACAAVLTSAVALTGCKGNQNEPEQKKEAVKTEFAISLPAQASSNGARRMPGATVPDNGTFLGMKNIKLIPFAKAGAIASGDPRLGDANINLDPIATGGLTTTGNAKVYSGISIPLTTSAFLVYAEATNAAAAGDADAAKHTNGYVKANGLDAGAPAGISFELEPVLGTAALASIYSNATAANLLTLLNNVANAQDENSKAWKAYTTGTDDAGMADIFATYSTMHALSSSEVLRVLSDLYKAVNPLTTGAAEPVKTLATNIQTEIKTGLNVDAEPYTLKDGYTGYPANLNLPDGSVRIKYDAGEFKPCEAADYDSKQTDPTKFVYPASLWYYANSNIKTANSSQKTLLENTTKTWTTIMSEYPTASTAVNTLTRSVAITNAIQYAVARLDVTVKLENTTLKDHIDQDITTNSTDGFPVSAVFVGGQRQVNFDFTPNTTATPYTIYDNVMKNTMNAKTTASAVNSTLVFETPATTKDENQEDADADIMIAIELTNNTDQDFIGANGQLIPKDGKFYLVGKMIASKASQTGKKVFKQDYTTTANLTIKTLANAYNEIPDLRTPQLELGMSVDLNWEAGHTYEIDL